MPQTAQGVRTIDTEGGAGHQVPHHGRGSIAISEGTASGVYGALPPNSEVAPQARVPSNGPLLQDDDDPSSFVNEQIESLVPQALQGRIEKIRGRKIEGWAWNPQEPGKRIRLDLIEHGIRLSNSVADNYRKELVLLGCGDGRHGFSLEVEEALLPEGRHVLNLHCADTGAEMPGSPVIADVVALRTPGLTTTSETEPTVRARGRVESGLDSDTASLLRTVPGVSEAAVNPNRWIRHTITRNDFARYRVVRRFTKEGDTAAVLAMTDCIRETGTIPSTFFTDCMIAVWQSRDDVQQRFQRLDEERCQYSFLVWFLCVRPAAEGLMLSSEPIGPILAAMSDVIVAEEPVSGAPCTALMLAAYCYVASYDGSRMLLQSQCQARDVVAWFFCEGAFHLQLSHALSSKIRADLTTPRLGLVAPIVRWAVDRMPDIAKEDGLEGILAWFDEGERKPAAAYWRDLLRESLIVLGRARFDGPAKPILPAVCGRLRNAVRNLADLLLIDGQPEYVGIGGNGERLLLTGEWYPAEQTFVWSRAPISTILFCVRGGTVEWLRIGLLFDQGALAERRMRVLLNHNNLWSGTVGDASSGELIFACTGECLAYDTPNLLQIEVEAAFVPADHGPSWDYRRLGIGLRRIWIRRAGESV